MTWYGPPICVCGAYMTMSDWSPLAICPRGCPSWQAGREIFFDTPPEVRFAKPEHVDAEPWLEQLRIDVDRDRLIQLQE